MTPHSSIWSLQTEYATILSVSGSIIVASFIAFSLSQVLDIFIYQKIKTWSQGKWLWLRSNISTYIGQTVDSIIFVSIVFHASTHKLNIIAGSIVVKIILSLLMTPIVYLIVIGVNRYLDDQSYAFKSNENELQGSRVQA